MAFQSLMEDLGKSFVKWVVEKIEDTVDKPALPPAIETDPEALRQAAAREAVAKTDITALVASLDARIPQYVAAVESAVASAIRNSSTRDLLAMEIRSTYAPDRDREILRPAFKSTSGNWGKLFFHYLKKTEGCVPCKVQYGQEFCGRLGPCKTLHAGVESIIEKAVEKASKAYFSSPAVCELLRQGIAREVRVNHKVQGVINGQLKSTGKWARQEVQDTVAAYGHAVAADRVHDSLVHAGHVVSGTVLGQAMLSALSMPVVKVVLVKAAGMALATEGVRLVIMKLGVTTLAVMLLGHAAAASLLMWVALPAMLAVLWVQWQNMPDTLADKLPGPVVAELRRQAPETNKKVVKSFLMEAFMALLKKMHEEGMEAEDSDSETNANIDSNKYSDKSQ